MKYLLAILAILGLFYYEHWSRQVILDRIDSINQPIELNGIILDQSAYNQLKSANRIIIEVQK